MNIVIIEENYSPEAVFLYKKLGPVYFGEKYLRAADILVVRLAINVTKKIIDSAPNLKIIATSTTGLNHIDTDYAQKRGVKIISLRGESGFLKNIPSTAEETMALVLSLLRNVNWAHEDVLNGKWRTNNWAGHQLLGKNLGLIRFGRLGKIVAKYARAFGMNVLASDPNVSANIIKKYGAKKNDLNTLLKKSDVVSLHVLLTEKTKNMIQEKHFRAMKRSAYFINTARAELISQKALYNALKNKWIAGAAIDVMDDEQADGRHLKKDPLWKYAKANKNLIIVPHIGGTTYEAKEVTQDFIADKVTKYLK